MIQPNAKLIAVVDDDTVFQFIAKRIIESTARFERILAFANGQVALEYLQENAGSPDMLPAYILLDINMPELDGFGFLGELDKHNGLSDVDFRIAILSSSNRQVDIDRARLHKRVREYFEKPVSADKIDALVQAG
jgi:CheY-like chemotaxis protein